MILYLWIIISIFNLETLLKRQAQKVFGEIKFGEDEKAQTNTFVLPVLLAEDKVHVDIF